MKNNARQLILQAMATFSPIVPDVRLNEIKSRPKNYAPKKANGGRPMFKQNRRAQMRRNRK